MDMPSYQIACKLDISHIQQPQATEAARQNITWKLWAVKGFKISI